MGGDGGKLLAMVYNQKWYVPKNVMSKCCNIVDNSFN